LIFKKKTELLWQYKPKKMASKKGFSFFLAPFAGGSAASLSDWFEHLLQENDDGYIIQYPERQADIEFNKKVTLKNLAKNIANDIVQLTNKPIVLIGHSFGGVLGYEISLILDSLNVKVELLVVSAASTPKVANFELNKILIKTQYDWIKDLKTSQMIDTNLIQNSELINMSIKSLRHDMILLAKNPQHNSKTQTFLLAIGGDVDPKVGLSDLEAWEELTDNFALSQFEGGHFYYKDKLPDVMNYIRKVMAKIANNYII